MIPIVYNGNIALIKLIKDQWCIRIFNSEHVVVEVMLVNKSDLSILQSSVCFLINLIAGRKFDKRNAY